MSDDQHTPWHEDPEFWTELQHGIFDPQLWAIADREVEQLLQLTGPARGAAVLDVPCGPGRHVVPLARRGYSVCGVDLNAVYLEEAQRRAEQAQVAVELVRADMREFVRPTSFDLVLNVYTSFGYSSDPADDLRTLQNWRRCLRPGGQLLLELITRETAGAGEPSTYRLDDARSITEHAVLAPDRSIIERRWTLHTPGGTRTWMAWHRLYDVPALCALVQSAGFGGARSYGGLDGRELAAAEGYAVVIAAA